MEEKGFNGFSDRTMMRFLVISEVKRRKEAGQAMTAAIAAVSAMVFYHPKTNIPATFSKRTIFRFLKECKENGVKGLEPKARKPSLTPSKIFTDIFVDFIKSEKTDDPYASTREIIERARLKGVISNQAKICRSSVYRLCVRLNLPISRSLSVHDKDMRRFAHPHRMMMTLTDGKHFNAGSHSAKRVVFTFLDDASRKALACVVGCSENTNLYLRGLDKTIRRFGYSNAVYLDRGPGFISHDTANVLAKLDIPLILGRVRYPEGHGKIERYHQTLINDLLRSFPGNPEIDPECDALELRIQHYLDEDYNNRIHESLNKKTPNEVFFSDERKLRIIADTSLYESSFIMQYSRKVSKDQIVSLFGMSYEMPNGYAMRRVNIFHNTLTDRIFIFHDNASVTLKVVDLALNALSRRSSPPSPNTTKIIPNTAASMRFNQTFNKAIDDFGNYISPTNEEQFE